MFFVSLIAKTVSLLSHFFGLGAGVTWPGEISLKLNHKLIADLSQQIKKGVIIIAGTNGKTTTASMIHHLLSATGAKVIHNATGANLLNGIAGTLILKTDFFGRLDCDYAIIEADEATLPLILKEIPLKIVVLLNLFRDQLDRYGEVDTIAQKWMEGLTRIPRGGSDTILIVNADDPLMAFIGKNYKGKKFYFGLENKQYDLGKLSHATDSIYCLNCGKKLNYQHIFLSHYGDWSCQRCGLKRPKIDLSIAKPPLPGVYNLYNTLAALLTVQQLGIDTVTSTKYLNNFTPAFGRQEIFKANGKKIQIFLSKNPAGFNESIRTVLEKKDLVTVLFVLNDRIPDGTDVSWIWDVDFEKIVQQAKKIICSGDRVYDMALRIKYSFESPSFAKAMEGKQNSKLKTFEKLEDALESGLQHTPKGETLYILPTYSAMLDIRKILVGRKIL